MESFRHILFLLMTAVVVLAVIKFKHTSSKDDGQRNCDSIFALLGKCRLIRKIFDCLKNFVCKTKEKSAPGKTALLIIMCLFISFLCSKEVRATAYGYDAFGSTKIEPSVSQKILLNIDGFGDRKADGWGDELADRTAAFRNNENCLNGQLFVSQDNIVSLEDLYTSQAFNYRKCSLQSEKIYSAHSYIKMYSLKNFASEDFFGTHWLNKIYKDWLLNKKIFGYIKISIAKYFTFCNFVSILSETYIVKN